MIPDNILALNSKSSRYIATDFLIITIIFLLPTLSHLTSISFYLFDPMRWAVVFCILNTNRKNSLIIALTIPVFSLLISSHPVFIKSLLITGELTLNVILFYIIAKRLKNTFIVMLISILIAKLFYYSGKWLFIHLGFLSSDLFSTSLWIQVPVVFLISVFVFFDLRNGKQVKLG